MNVSQKLPLIFTLLLALLFMGCSRRISPLPQYSAWEAYCECPGSNNYQHPISERFLISQPAPYGLANIRDDEFNSLVDQWNYLNDTPVDSNSTEYRLTTVPFLSKGYSVRIIFCDSSTVVVFRAPFKNQIAVSTITYPPGIRHEFEQQMDTLFWTEPFESDVQGAVNDGTGYYFEGMRGGAYKMIARASGNIHLHENLKDKYIELATGLVAPKCPGKLKCGSSKPTQ